MSEKGKDVNQRHMENTLPHDPEKEAKPANGAAAKVVQMRRQLKPISLADGFAQILEEVKSGRATMGLTTGHFRLDARLHGLRRKHVTALGGRTSFGKTSKALQICDLNMKANPLFISVEDSTTMSLRRIMARRARVNALRLRDNRCTAKEIESIQLATKLAERKPFFLDAIGVPVEDICVAIREHCKEHDCGLVVFDYLQKAQSKKRHQDRRVEVGYYANLLGDTIKECNAAGLLLSQLARPDKKQIDVEPTMYDLKEAGEIENAVEHIMIGHTRKEPIPGSKQELKIKQIRLWKNKDGPLFDEVIDQDFDPVTASFRETVGQVFEDDTDADDDAPPPDDPRFID